MHKQILQNLTVGAMLLAGVAFLLFALRQVNIDAQAQAIVQYNSQFLSSYQSRVKSITKELLAVKVNFEEQVSPEKQQLLRILQQKSQQISQEIASVELRLGVNTPSSNNQELVQQKLVNLSLISQTLDDIGYLYICLNQQVRQLNNLQKQLDQQLSSYGIGTTYADSQQILIGIEQSYADITKNIDGAIACFRKQLQTTTLFSSLQEIAQRDQGIINNYRQQYLQPLVELYRREDYAGVTEFQNQNTEAGRVSLIFPSLFKPQKDSLDVFQARWSSYAEGEIRAVLTEAITNL